MKRTQTGFTPVEIAIALVIVGRAASWRARRWSPRPRSRTSCRTSPAPRRP